MYSRLSCLGGDLTGVYPRRVHWLMYSLYTPRSVAGFCPPSNRVLSLSLFAGVSERGLESDIAVTLSYVLSMPSVKVIPNE